MGIKPGKPRSRQSLRRKSQNRSSRYYVLIVCEGAETEPTYFKALCAHLQLGGKVKIAGKECQSAPIKVIEYANREKKNAERDRNPYDAAWAVVDRDQHGRMEQAIEKALSCDITLALSVPCFEFWLLLHQQYTTRPFADCTELKTKVEQLAGNTAPDKYIAELATGETLREVAKRNARRVTEHHENLSSSSLPNPSTQIHELVESLEALAARL